MMLKFFTSTDFGICKFEKISITTKLFKRVNKSEFVSDYLGV